MNVEFTGRHIDVTPPIRDFANEKLTRLEKYISGVLDVHVILSVEKYRHIAEIVVTGKNLYLRGVEETADMYSSVGQAVEKIERQAKRHKEKLESRRRRGGATGGVESFLNVDVYSTDSSAATGESAPTVIKSSRFSIKPMTVEEAVLQLGGSKREFIVFRNSQSEGINVIYKRKDGDYGLIDPDAD